MSLAVRYAAYLSVAALALAVGVPAPAPARADEKPAEEKAAEARPIDLVLCLDVSGSMNGLVDSAKIKLWEVVNEMARLKPTPNLRVALYSYGHTSYPADNGWVRKDVDLTGDLDDVYKALNSLTINGGTEYVARVTKAALTEQKWSTDPTALKIIFVCGNEPADQDKQVSLDEVAGLAKKDGVIVNTIYCKWGHDNEVAGWAGFSAKCGGRHLDIDQNRAVRTVTVKTEFDEQILKLSESLNKTYVCYGKDRDEKAANQVAQDANALRATAPPAGGTAGGRGAAGGVAAPPAAPVAALGRAVTKANALYCNPTWDLVDRMKEKDFDITKIKDEDLPEEMKKMKPEERLPYLKKKAEERASIQKEINDLSAKRQKKIDEELAKQPKSDADKALDEAVKGIVREQAKAKGFDTPPQK
jgi:hypothetical protein